MLLAFALAFLGPQTVSAQQNQSEPILFRLNSRFDPVTGALFYELIDFLGNTVQRIEQYYAVPPIAQCNITLWSTVQQQLIRNQISLQQPVNLRPSDPLQCCNYYLPRSGYQFTQCERNLGPFIFGELVFSPASEQFKNDVNLGYNNVSWSGLFQLVNQYCASGAFFGGNTNFLQIPVPWYDWYLEYLTNPNLLTWGVPQLKNWTLHYEQFLNSGGSQYILNSVNTYTQPQHQNNRRRNLQANPNVFNGPNPLNVPIGENFTDFTYVPLPGVNAYVQPFNQQLRSQGFLGVPNPYFQQVQQGAVPPNNNQYMSTSQNQVWPPQQYGSSFIFIPIGGADSQNLQGGVQGGYIYPPYGPYAYLLGNQSNSSNQNVSFWLPEYDNMNINQVRQNLTERGIYPSFLQWWNYFWGVNGIAVQYFQIANITDGTQPNMTQPITISDLSMTTIVNGVVITSSNIPPAMQQIVNWVLMVVTSQVKANCAGCADQPVQIAAMNTTMTNATVTPGPTNTTANSTSSVAQTITPGTTTGTGTGTTTPP